MITSTNFLMFYLTNGARLGNQTLNVAACCNNSMDCLVSDVISAGYVIKYQPSGEGGGGGWVWVGRNNQD